MNCQSCTEYLTRILMIGQVGARPVGARTEFCLADLVREGSFADVDLGMGHQHSAHVDEVCRRDGRGEVCLAPR
jgi:hypothetical protein